MRFAGGAMVRALFALASLLPAGAAHAQPDLTGVWSLASRPMTSAQGYPDVPLTPEGRRVVDEYRALVDPRGENPTQWCVSHGMPEMMMGGGSYPLEIIQKPDQVTFIGEAMSETRRVYLGERVVPEADRVESRHGYSVGSWEGDTLVVETAQLQELPDSRFPHSAEARITERFQLLQDADGGARLVADTVVTDPLWLERPLEYRLEWIPARTDWILPYECRETEWLDHLETLREQAARP